MKKWLRTLALLLAALTLLGLIPAACAEEGESPFRTFVFDLPKGIKKANEQAGTVTKETYTTYVYDENGNPGEAMEATLYVYTPCGYDAGKEYNILYLMHGGGDNEGYWFGMAEYAEGGAKWSKAQQKYTVNVVDNMIANGTCGEVIIVTPTFYNNYNKTQDLARFMYEMKNDIIPTVEAKYATYAKGDVTPENLIATRDHRAYAGLSMGSMTGFEAIWGGCVDYISWIGNFSGFAGPGDAVDRDGAAQRLVDTKNGAFADYPVNYWYNGTGTKDSAEPDHVAGYALILAKGANFLQEGEDLAAGDNCILVNKPEKGHAYNGWIVDLYNVLQVFFTK